MLEKQVLASARSRLDVWQMKKVVLHYDNLDMGRKYINGRWIMNTKKGRPDLVAYIIHNELCWIYFIELKRPKGGIWGDAQRLFADKFQDIGNVIYEIVTDPNQIDITIELITSYNQNILDNMKI